MDLAVHQRAMLGLFRATYRVSDDDEPYISRVAQSQDLQEARGNVLMWRFYVLQRTCPLSLALLQRHGVLRRAIEDFIAQCNISPFRENSGVGVPGTAERPCRSSHRVGGAVRAGTGAGEAGRFPLARDQLERRAWRCAVQPGK